jgi:TolA-binding protein
MRTRTFTIVVGLSILCGLTATASAQLDSSAPNRYFDRFVSNSSTVSPYLGLVTSQQAQGAQQGYIPPAVYQERVRPQLERRKQDEDQRRQIAQIQGQLNDVRQTFQQRQQNNFGATGHPTRFMLYQQYYPGFARLRR